MENMRTTRRQSAINAVAAEEQEQEQSDEVSASIMMALRNAEEKAKQTEDQNAHKVQVHKESGRKRAANCELKVSGTAIHDLKKLKYENFLSRPGYAVTTKDSAIQMFSQFITYVKEQHRSVIPHNTSDTKAIMLTVIDSNRYLFSEYSDFLTTAPVNRRKRIESIIHVVSFLREKHHDNTAHCYNDALSVLGGLRKQLTKAANKRSPDHSVNARMRNNSYPQRGLQEIMEYLDDGWGYFDAIVAAAQAGYQLTEPMYLYCLRYVLCTLWGYDNNARGLAIELVCIGDISLSLENHDFSLSQHFKTYQHYEYQILKFSQIIKDVWIPLIRNQVSHKTGNQRVFLSYSGNALKDGDVSRHLQTWFRRYGLVITVTTMRQILEASYKEAAVRQVISSAARSSLTLSQGHTEQTAERYYNIAKSNIVGSGAAQSILDAIDNNDHYTDVCSALAPHSADAGDVPSRVGAIMKRQSCYEGLLDRSAFGGTWSGKNTGNGKRFEWTDQEIEWMYAWFLTHPSISNRYSACLHALYEAPSHIKAMFHPHHVENSDRLKTGAQRAERKVMGGGG